MNKNVNESKTMTTSMNKCVSGYKVIKVNLSEPTDNLYAVVTPIKIKD